MEFSLFLVLPVISHMPLFLWQAFKDTQAGVKPPGVWKTLLGVISQVRTTNNLQRCKMISGLDVDRSVVQYRDVMCVCVSDEYTQW